jgi:hypothetical protein
MNARRATVLRLPLRGADNACAERHEMLAVAARRLQ